MTVSVIADISAAALTDQDPSLVEISSKVRGKNAAARDFLNWCTPTADMSGEPGEVKLIYFGTAFEVPCPEDLEVEVSFRRREWILASSERA